MCREHGHGPREPPQPTPGNGAVREPPKTGWLPLRLRLACSPRSGRRIKDHHRTAERHTPQPARVSLAELRGFPEIPLSELRIDLRLRTPCTARYHEQEWRDEMVPSPHPHPSRGALSPNQRELEGNHTLLLPHNAAFTGRRSSTRRAKLAF